MGASPEVRRVWLHDQVALVVDNFINLRDTTSVVAAGVKEEQQLQVDYSSSMVDKGKTSRKVLAWHCQPDDVHSLTHQYGTSE